MQNRLINLKKLGYLKLENVDLDILNVIEKKISNAFRRAIKLSNNNDLSKEKFNHFIKRKERGSLDLDCVKESEELSKKLVSKLEIIDLAKEYWNCNKIKYSSSFSKFRYVDPNDISQIKYSPLHKDGDFLENKESINICIPFTGYGADYPGLQIFPLTHNKLKKKLIQKTSTLKFINIILNSERPIVKRGSYICFNQDVFHRRTIDNSNKIRINLEFRIFPNYINNPDLNLKVI
jgi:hypothetical protein